MTKRSVPQNYPRIHEEGSRYDGFLDDSKLQQHTHKIPDDELQKIILNAIRIVNAKSSRRLLAIPDNATEQEINDIYKRRAKDLFDYFRKSYADPASSAHQCLNRHYSAIAREQFRGRTIQSERMNSGWRYQYIVKDAALKSRRFDSVSDVGAKEADFNAVINIKDSDSKLTIYISFKNRADTIGGQDMPKAIQAMEDVAKNDKNRVGSYICVFGVAMQKGIRKINTNQQTRENYSVNTEMWLSDYFWSFFSNYSYKEIVMHVLKVLIATQQPDDLEIEIPAEVILYFGDYCKANSLVDDNGNFNNAYALINFFCGVT